MSAGLVQTPIPSVRGTHGESIRQDVHGPRCIDVGKNMDGYYTNCQVINVFFELLKELVFAEALKTFDEFV